MPRGTRRAAALALVGALAAGCSGGANPLATESDGGPPLQREYWPTDGWRTGDPADHGLDAGEVAEVERMLAEAYTTVRSVLVVRDGLPVCERGATLRQLLSLTSGLPFDDPTIAGDPTIFGEVNRHPDRIRATLGLPLAADPGTRWGYSNASSDLLAAAVAEATGRPLLDVARERLFGPLGHRHARRLQPVVVGWPPTADQSRRHDASAVAWPVDAQGYHWGASGLRLPAGDLAKIAFLYLNGGRWEYHARGFGGQVVEVVPGLDLVAVVTGDPEVPRGDGHTFVNTFIVPAAED